MLTHVTDGYMLLCYSDNKSKKVTLLSKPLAENSKCSTSFAVPTSTALS